MAKNSIQQYILLKKTFFLIYFYLCCNLLACAQHHNIFPSDSIKTFNDGGRLTITPYYKGKIHGWTYGFESSYNGAETEYELIFKDFSLNGQLSEIYVYMKGALLFKVLNIKYFSTQEYIKNKIWLPCYSCRYDKGYIINYEKNGEKTSEGHILFNSYPDYEYLKIDKWIYYNPNGEVKKIFYFKTPKSE